MPISLEEFERKDECELLLYGGASGRVLNLLRESQKAWSIKELQAETKISTQTMWKLKQDGKVVQKGSYFILKELVSKNSKTAKKVIE